MHRALIKMIVSLALAAGLTISVVAATEGAASAAPKTAAAAATCSTEQANYDSAVAHKQTIQHKLKKARHALRVAKRHHNRAKVRKLRHRIHRLERRLDSAKSRVASTRTSLETCQAGGGTSSPIQSLCDQGVPQPVCDGLGALAGGGSGASFQQLCDAAPQAQPLCDAAAGGGFPSDPSQFAGLLTPVLDALGLGALSGGGLPSDFTSIQALCDAGAPQAVCDGLAGAAGGGVPSDLSLQQLCDAASQAQPLCDAVNSGGGIPTDPTALTDLLGPVLDALGLGGLLGGGLPLPRQTA
ncbi:MAG TPA: hypothetical protein VNS55_13325 [Nocardioides sp.]|nr:hypothetical protein [Nocardioides sp.]